MLKSYYTYFLVLAMIAMFSCCKKDKPAVPPPANPCAGQNPTTADFYAEEEPEQPITTDGWIPYPTDTVSGCNTWVIIAKQDTPCTYTWYIGSDVYHTKSVSLYYGTALNLNRDTFITVTLMVQRTPNKTCFPNDRGADTVTKKIYYRFESQSATRGSYQGYLMGNPNDTFTVTLLPWTLNPNYQYPIYPLYLINIPRGCKGWLGGNGYSEVGNKEINFSADQCVFDCPNTRQISGRAMLGPDTNTITINYTYYVDTINSNTATATFIGKRVK